MTLCMLGAIWMSACGSAHRGAHTATSAAIAPGGRELGRLSTPGTPKGEQTIHVEVIARPGPKRAALALVPVYINKHGPYPFALDTGASRSLIASGLAKELHFPESGSEGIIRGVGGTRRAGNAFIGNWRAGGVLLPPTDVAVELGGSQQPEPRTPTGGERGPVGLLGSDVLSRYGKIAVDYDKQLLILDPPVK
jgi:Aspartyl protease